MRELIVSTLCLMVLVRGAPQYGSNSDTLTLEQILGASKGGSGGGGGVDSGLSSSAYVECKIVNATVYNTTYVQTTSRECRTESRRQCETLYHNKCRNVVEKKCSVVSEQLCRTVTETVCTRKYRTEYVKYVETECKEEYKPRCEYRWDVDEDGSKVWVVVPGSCKDSPHTECRNVTKQKEVQVPYDDCRDQPTKACQQVPRQVCRDVTRQVCNNVPYEKCRQVPKQVCEQVHKKVPKKVKKIIKKRVCRDKDGKKYEFVVTARDNEKQTATTRGGKGTTKSSDAVRFS